MIVIGYSVVFFMIIVILLWCLSTIFSSCFRTSWCLAGWGSELCCLQQQFRKSIGHSIIHVSSIFAGTVRRGTNCMCSTPQSITPKACWRLSFACLLLCPIKFHRPLKQWAQAHSDLVRHVCLDKRMQASHQHQHHHHHGYKKHNVCSICESFVHLCRSRRSVVCVRALPCCVPAISGSAHGYPCRAGIWGCWQ